MKHALNAKKTLSLTIATFLATSALLIAGSSTALAQNQPNEADFKIKDFGIKDGKPWITVEGKAGASTPQNLSQIYVYAFGTDKGMFAVASHGVEDSAEVENDTAWHTHGGVTLDEKKCLVATDLNDDGTAIVTDQVEIGNITATKVDTVTTALLGINNADGSICIEKVFDSKNSTNSTQS